MTVRSDENTAGEVARPRRLHRPAPLPRHLNRRPPLAVAVGGEPRHQSGEQPVRSVNPTSRPSDNHGRDRSHPRRIAGAL